MNSTEALTGLASIVGGGGVVSAFIAYMSYKTEAMKGRKFQPDGQSTVLAIGEGFSNSKHAEALTLALTTLTVSINKLVEYHENLRAEETEHNKMQRIIDMLRTEIRDAAKSRDREREQDRDRETRESRERDRDRDRN